MPTNHKSQRMSESRANARLDIAGTDFVPDITVQQADGLKTEGRIQGISRRALDLKVKTYLASAGISVVHAVYYHAFALEVNKCIGAEGGGMSGRVAVNVLRDKWIARGLALATLNGLRSAVFGLPAAAPLLTLDSVLYIDAPPGNEDGIVNPGETADVLIGLLNSGGITAGGPTGVLVSDHPLLVVADPAGEWNDIPRDGIETNGADLFQVVADPTIPPTTEVNMTLTVTSNGGADEDVLEFVLTIG